MGVGLSFAAWDGKTKTKPSKTETIDKQKYFLIENEANLAWFADSANKYELDSGKNNQKNPATYNIESENIELKIPSKTGYTFEGWYYDKKFSKVYELDAVYKQNSTLTLYPYWVEDPTYKKDPSSIRDFASVRIHGFGIVVQNRGLEIVNVRPGRSASVKASCGSSS